MLSGIAAAALWQCYTYLKNYWISSCIRQLASTTADRNDATGEGQGLLGGEI